VAQNWVNWTLVIGGGICIAAELMLGALTGFDLALLGGCLVLGGALGLGFASTKVGLFASGGLALVYVALFRNRLRQRLTSTEQPSNVDALVGRSGVVTGAIAQHSPGQVKVGDELWRAELAGPQDAPRKPGEVVTVAAVDGVTLKVR